MTISAKTESFWDKLENLPFPAIISLAPDYSISDVSPERTLGIWLNLTQESYEALIQVVSLGLKMRQHHLWCEAKKNRLPIPDPLVAEEKYRLMAWEVVNAVSDFPLEGGTIVFVDDEPCPDIIIETITEAREDDEVSGDCVPDDPE